MKELVAYDMNRIIKTIIHLSDIHIRLDVSFEAQYHHVFANTLEKIKMNLTSVSEAVIVITGDFFHVKDRLSPNAESLAVCFLKDLSRIAPVVLIMGNHDVLVHNSESILDTISAVLYERPNLRIHYLRDSGVYRFYNLIFIHNSVIDATPASWIYADPIWKCYQEDQLIHLFHGQVDSCLIDNGIRLSSPFKLHHFKEADLILLGDIHRHQFFSSNMAYAGSLLCQNISEAMYAHGFIVWNVGGSGSKFIRVPNHFEPIRIDIIKNDVIRFRELNFSSIEILVKKLKRHDTIKTKQDIIVYKHDTNFSDQTIRELFQKTFSRSITIKISNKKNLSSLKRNDVETKGDLQVHLDSLLEQFIGTTFPVKNPVLYKQKILEKLRLIKDNREWSNADVHFKVLKFSHMFGYGKNNIIEFSGSAERPLVRMVCGKNSVGKSTIIDILTFVLFNRITRYASGNKTPKELIHEKQSSAEVSLTFFHGADKYEISKYIEKSKPIRLVLKKNEQNISMAVRQITEKTIIGIFGTYEQFLNSYVCLQGHGGKNFKEKTPKEQKDELFHLFQVDKFENIYQEFHKASHKLYMEMNSLQARMDSRCYHTQDEVMSQKTILTKENLEFSACQDEIDRLERQIQVSNTHRIRLNCLIDEQARLVDCLKRSTIAKAKIPSELVDIPTLQAQLENMESVLHQHEGESQFLWKLIIDTDKKLAPLKEEPFTFEYIVFLKNSDYDKESLPSFSHKLSRLASFPLSEWFPKKEEDIRSEIQSAHKFLRDSSHAFNKRSNECVEIMTEYRNLVKDKKRLHNQLICHNTVEYNPNCHACMSNPFREEKCRLELELEQVCENIVLNQKEHAICIYELNQILDKCNNYAYLQCQLPLIVDISTTVNFHKQMDALDKALKRLSDWNVIFEECLKNYHFFLSMSYHRIGFVVRRGYLRRRIDMLRAEIKKTKEIISIMADISNNENLEVSIVKIQDEIRHIKTSLVSSDNIMNSLATKRVHYNHLIQHRTRLQIQIDTMMKENSEWEAWNVAYKDLEIQSQELKIFEAVCHRDAFPLFYIRNSLRYLETEMNILLENFIERKVRLCYEDETLIFQTVGSVKDCGFNFYGGMESFMLDLAVKIVFAKFAPLARPTLFIMDENISVLDEERLQNIAIIFNFLKTFFHDIIIISHQPSLQDHVDEMMMIEKDKDQYSHILN